ncbi:hypothetical protein BAR24_03395 [Gluconobacter oxydans]|uniref:ABC transporter substrate-binding protein n=1 Tax=Gluconobacter thailandicus TaxID=257438 RepID=UPI0002996321|nr:ABC transporter substrate-binding protein [Gluconobacter thailandicus]AFW00713.1 hypothetical protein B932_1128 [Gluconobacter oxydans H24]ANQ40594.1 hypothetical protein BAR24_03395 [Gluconobacter oxydans]
MTHTALRIAQEKVDFLPPNRVTDDRSILTLKGLVLEPLCIWKDGNIEPGLFERWETDLSGRGWSFHLRENPVFHDGHRCTASDVVAFIEAICQSTDTFGMKWSYARYFEQAVFSASSETCLRVVMLQPLGDLPEIFSEFYLSRPDPRGQFTIGTGRYRVDTFTPQTYARLRSEADPEKIVEFLAIPDVMSRMEVLQNAHVDAACQMEALPPFTNQPREFEWISERGCLSVMAYLNCSQGLFSNPEARIAANLALDQENLCKTVYNGHAIPASTIVSPFHFGFNRADIPPTAYDPATAQFIFSSLNREEPVILRTPTFMPEHAPAIAEFIKQSLERAGLTVQIEVVHDRPDYARQIGRKDMADIALFDSSPHSTFRILNDKISSRTQGVWWQGFDDPVLEGFIKTANETISPVERSRRYASCLSRLRSAPPWLYLAHPDSIVATRSGIKGLSLDHKGSLILSEEEHP